ncbi:hypothetical protein LZ31DRAFT_13672 [Colletotrichum somersetense]|nr:hypothetical protein LZ31DRAFT_13672 [Colletotrichum somersetense]
MRGEAFLSQKPKRFGRHKPTWTGDRADENVNGQGDVRTAPQTYIVHVVYTTLWILRRTQFRWCNQIATTRRQLCNEPPFPRAPSPNSHLAVEFGPHPSGTWMVGTGWRSPNVTVDDSRWNVPLRSGKGRVEQAGRRAPQVNGAWVYVRTCQSGNRTTGCIIVGCEGQS